MKILVFDTETTGLPEKNASIYDLKKWPYIIQISYILFDICNNTSISKNHYIQLENNIVISDESYEKHKINKELLDISGENIKIVLNEFNKFLALSDIVVGHNISFDKQLIFVECFRNKIDQNFTKFINNKKITKNEYCTMKNSKHICNIVKVNKFNKPYYKSPSLSELYKKIFPNEFLPNDLHNSIIDVLCTLRCYIMLEYNYDICIYNINIYNEFNNLNY